jgi:hypothetical protein
MSPPFFALTVIPLQYHHLEICQNYPHIMAPRLPPSKLHLIHDMIQSESLTTSQMTDAAECSERSFKNIRRNLRQFGSTHALPNRIDRRRSISPPMLEALCHHLLKKPSLYLDEMAIFPWDEFQMLAMSSSGGPSRLKVGPKRPLPRGLASLVYTGAF